MDSNTTVLEKPAEVVRIAKTTILFPNDSLDIPVSNYFPPNNPFLVSSNSSKIINQFLPQEVKSVGHNIKLSNLSSEPLILEKNMHAFIVRAIESKVEAHKPLKDMPMPVYKHTKNDTQVYLAKLTVDPDKIISNQPEGKTVLELLDKINNEHHSVFDSDLSVGYNGASVYA